MSTNAAIGMTMPDGTIKAVYLHWDGYITDGGAGETLSAHYKDQAKVEKLISLGFLSSLGAEVDPDPTSPHSWSNPQPGVTVAYPATAKSRFNPQSSSRTRIRSRRRQKVVFGQSMPICSRTVAGWFATSTSARSRGSGRRCRMFLRRPAGS